jgi:riboflavin kinase/FMN adenylyltransferase
MLPANGVYATKVRIGGPAENKIYFDAVTNIGKRPTFANRLDENPIVEVHLLDFNQDIYGKKLEIYFYKYLRPEVKFPGPEALKEQIDQDCKAARQLFSKVFKS